jgi:hypothetical protein
MKEAAREVRIAALPDDALQRISLAGINADGRWEEVGKECWYKGHLYDVIRRRTLHDITWFYCLDDDGEERLIQGSVDVTKANQDLPGERSRHSLNLSIGDMLCEAVGWELGSLPGAKRHYPPAGVCRLAFCYSAIVIPPPKICALVFG